MYSDVVDLRDFYATRLGEVARRLIRQRIRSIWPDVSGLRVLGLGYANPYLRPFLPEAERVLSFMPARQGVLHWPKDAGNLAALVHENELPLQNFSVDRILMVHALEGAPEADAMLSEVWRVLAGGGRVLVVVPNRRGIWARLDLTPFGAGSPYTLNQLTRLLRQTAFTPLSHGHALYVPPSHSRMMLRAAPAWEKIGERWFPGFSGIVMVEATKQLYARPRVEAVSARRIAYRPAATPI
jgi:SAM-dependent methyltransferase